MKIQPEHYRTLQDAVWAVVKARPDAWAVYQERGWSAKRFRWDVLRAAGLMPWVCDELYLYLNDEHIYTALRRALPLEGYTA